MISKKGILKYVTEWVPGDTAKFNHPNSGYGGDIEQAEKFLTAGKTYILQSIEIGDWSSSVVLKEFPDLSFNSVLFDVEKKEEKR